MCCAGYRDNQPCFDGFSFRVGRSRLSLRLLSARLLNRLITGLVCSGQEPASVSLRHARSTGLKFEPAQVPIELRVIGAVGDTFLHGFARIIVATLSVHDHASDAFEQSEVELLAVCLELERRHRISKLFRVRSIES